MSNITEDIDTKQLSNLTESIDNIEYTIKNFTHTIHDISDFIGKYNPKKISIPYTIIAIGLFAYTFFFIILYNCNYICNRICNKQCNKIKPVITDDN